VTVHDVEAMVAPSVSYAKKK